MTTITITIPTDLADAIADALTKCVLRASADAERTVAGPAYERAEEATRYFGDALVAFNYARDIDPLARECGACGAESGEDCRWHCTARPDDDNVPNTSNLIDA